MVLFCVRVCLASRNLEINYIYVVRPRGWKEEKGMSSKDMLAGRGRRPKCFATGVAPCYGPPRPDALFPYAKRLRALWPMCCRPQDCVSNNITRVPRNLPAEENTVARHNPSLTAFVDVIYAKRRVRLTVMTTT